MASNNSDARTYSSNRPEQNHKTLDDSLAQPCLSVVSETPKRWNKRTTKKIVESCVSCFLSP
ncbi:hypothetical protein Pan181_31790 [Aeoliella mucimassa]|uniref:Uncharacterized protein n=1 Tax=Aeoliella mucimassa TaxID=2527972 RepID=A0A518AQI0_9BACT|nr:hypothetical protein Pan181_31790 [Aeoliella mucimassa]